MDVFFFLLAAFLFVTTLVASSRKASALSELNASRAELQRRDAELADLRKRNAVLEKYAPILDAEAHVRRLLDEATAEASRLRKEAEEALSHARKDARALKEQAGERLAGATVEAGRIVENANARAEQIAGEALTALRKAEQLEEAAKAMKNIIEGYGDRYLVPTHGLLDDLAEAFGYTEAGQRLKAARDRMRLMIDQGTAATSDYVEASRRGFAIDFVLDAFNGKVDSALSSVKHDNFGTLERKIRDGYATVNHNGAAFRSTRITPEYLDVRLDELKWAVIVQELKRNEKEEQRAIKERIREEERAQREFEKALKEAAKEEDVLRKAMEKAQREVERATDEQRAEFEAKLRELNEKLQAAEEKNQRALSMAQQTKAGHVYIISNVGSFGEDVFKIGLTRRLEPLDRVRELGDASVPFEFDVHALIYAEDAPGLEHELHKRFVRTQMNKVNSRKEFFRVGLKSIREEIERLGLQTKWTMTAEAREYKESLAIERAMHEQRFDEAKWAEQQVADHDAALSSIAGVA